MDIVKQVIEQVQVQYTVDEDGYIYQGILVFTPEEYAKQTDKTMDAAIAVVYDKWMEHMLAPIHVPTDEEKTKRLEQIERDLTSLAGEKVKLTAELTAVIKAVK